MDNEIYIVEEDIRLKLAKYDNTIVRAMKGKLNDLLKKIPSNFSVNIGVNSETISSVENNNFPEDSNIYIQGNIIYTNVINDYNKYLGACYGSDIVIILLNKFDDKLFQVILENIGKFQQVFVLNNTKEVNVGDEPLISLELGDSIIASYPGFIRYFEDLTTDQLIMDNSGLLTLMFPTDKEVPDENEQRVQLTLIKAEIDQLESNELGLEKELVFKCDIFHNSKFIDSSLKVFFLILESFGIFYVDNSFNIFNYELFDEYIVSSKYVRVYQIFLRLLIFMNAFNLIAHHDNFKDFLLNLTSEYNLNSNYNNYWKYY